MKFAQKAWSILLYDVCCSVCRNHSPKINDVIGEVAYSLALKEAPEITVMVHVRNYLHVSAKSLRSKKTQVVIFSWIVDVATQQYLLWPAICWT